MCSILKFFSMKKNSFCACALNRINSQKMHFATGSSINQSLQIVYQRAFTVKTVDSFIFIHHESVHKIFYFLAGIKTLNFSRYKSKFLHFRKESGKS